jgi:hypothetical protein
MNPEQFLILVPYLLSWTFGVNAKCKMQNYSNFITEKVNIWDSENLTVDCTFYNSTKSRVIQTLTFDFRVKYINSENFDGKINIWEFLKCDSVKGKIKWKFHVGESLILNV